MATHQEMISIDIAIAAHYCISCISIVSAYCVVSMCGEKWVLF